MKRIRFISIITAVVLLTACCVIPVSAALPPQIFPFGDVNFDNELTVSDATTVQQAAAEMVEFNIYESKTADINHDGYVTVADATLIQMVAAEMEIPEDCGGEIDLEIRVYWLEAEYISGSMPAGMPITFTAYAYGDSVSYDFLVNNEVVQPRSDSNKFTYTFEKDGAFLVTVKAYNKWGISDSETLTYLVLDSVDYSQPRIIDSKLMFNMDNIEWNVQAQGGTAPYTYIYIISDDYLHGLSEWDIEQFKIYKKYNETDWELGYDEDFDSYYLYKDFSEDTTAYIPYGMLSGSWYDFSVGVKDANGDLSDLATFEEGINLME